MFIALTFISESSTWDKLLSKLRQLDLLKAWDFAINLKHITKHETALQNCFGQFKVAL